LRGVEGAADRGQRDVGDGEVEVGDGRDEDQGREDQALALRDRRGLLGGRAARG
jgi:hypothetical protein